MARRRGRKKFSAWNTAIAILSLICLAFVTSIVHRYWRGGTHIETPVFSPSPPNLTIDYHEQSTFTSIEVEILNGCGVKGIAQQFTDFLRSHQIDVVRTENANHFDYETTFIIQRNQFVESSYRIAELLKIPKSDTTRILIQPDLSLEADVTLIIGKDYTHLRSFQEFLSKQP